MWKFAFVVAILTWTANGQEQFHREVVNPSGPSQVILRGGSLNSIGNGEELQPFAAPEQGRQQVEERYVLTDQPDQGITPFQSPQETPIPLDGGEGNPFTNGENGFGLRLSQQQQPVPQQPQQVQQVQSAQPQAPAPQAPQGPQLVQHQFSIYQQQEAVEINQPASNFHETEINLPQLPPGQQYVDQYGRPIVLEQPPQLQVVQQQPTPTSPPAAAPQPQIQTQTLPSPPQQVLVDQFGRQLTQQHLLTQHVLQPGTVQVTQEHHHVVQPGTVQVTQEHHHVLQPGTVQVTQEHHHILQPGTVQVTQEHHHVLQPGTVQVTQEHHVLQQPAAVAAETPTAVVQSAPVAVPVGKKKFIKYAPLTLQTYAVPAVRKVGNLVIPYAQKLQFAGPPPADVVFPPTVPAPAVVKSRHRTVLSPTKVLTPAVHEVHHHVQPVVQEVHALPSAIPVAHQQLQFAQPAAPVEIHHHQPALTAVHAAPGQVLVQHQQPVALTHHHPQQLVHLAQPPTHILHHPQHLVHHVEQHVPLTSPVVEHHIHQQPQAVVPVAPAVHVEKHVVPAAPAPVVVKKVEPVVPVVPEVTLIHQPVLSPVKFQQHIFNVKHGSEPIIYQDLCTVYPYQKNLRACQLKKAVLPELHHPDVRTVNVEESPQTDQSRVAAGSPVVVPAPPSSSPSVTVTKALPQNIQDTIRRESARLKEAATKNAETTASAPTSSVQPDAAESRESSRTGKSRRKKSSRRHTSTTEKPFNLA